MRQGTVNFVFGLLFNVAVAALIAGALLFIGALRGSIDMVWVGRIGIAIEILGVAMLALDYVGVTQHGQSPLRWWLRRLINADSNAPMPTLWPRQVVLILGVGALVAGLALQLVSSWDLSV